MWSVNELIIFVFFTLLTDLWGSISHAVLGSFHLRLVLSHVFLTCFEKNKGSKPLFLIQILNDMDIVLVFYN